MRVGQPADDVMYAGGSATFDESTGTYRVAVQPALPPAPASPDMRAISDAGMCFDPSGAPIPPAGAAPGSFASPWWLSWSAYRAPRQERTSTMYQRPAFMFTATPSTLAMARLGLGAPMRRTVMTPSPAPASRAISSGVRTYSAPAYSGYGMFRRLRGLAGLGQEGDFFDPSLFVDYASDVMPATVIPDIASTVADSGGGWFSSIDWGAIGGAAAGAASAIFKVGAPLATQAISQQIWGTRPTTSYTPPGRPPAPPGYAYTATGQLVQLTAAGAIPTPSSWVMPVVLGGAALGAGYLFLSRRRR